MTKDHPPCPKCASTHVAAISYGMPMEIDTDAVDRGEIIYAGCRVIIGESCRWKCNACGERFGLLGIQDAYTPEDGVIQAPPPSVTNPWKRDWATMPEALREGGTGEAVAQSDAPAAQTTQR